MMRRALLVVLGLVVGCAHAVEVENFGESNLRRVWSKLASLESGKGSDTVRILQLGDSHTAGEYFTHALRTRLQARFGNAGYGWLTPGHVTNQRSAQVLQRMKGGWNTQISKVAQGDYPLGGISSLGSSGAELEVAPKSALADGLWRLTLWTRSHNGRDGWNVVLPGGDQRALPANRQWQAQDVMFSSSGAASIRLQPDGNGSELGAISLDRLNPGVVYDSLGIVGAQVRVMHSWNRKLIQAQLQWRSPDLIILAYGTNEAFDAGFTDVVYRAELRGAIRMLRRDVPNAAILLVGAPSSAKRSSPNLNGGCRLPLPPNQLRVQRIQRDVARQEKLLYWDWAEAMGGNCAIQDWVNANPPLAQGDLVHLSAAGYEVSGSYLFEALMRAYTQRQR